MAEILGDLVVRIGGDSTDLQSAMHKAKTAIGDFAGSARHAIPNVAAMGAAAAAAAAVGVAMLISKTMDAVGAQADLANRLGTTSTSIANLSHAAMLSGVEIGKVESSSEFLARQLSKASESGSTAADTFARLKLNAGELQAMPLDQRIATINQALFDNVAASDRAAVAAELYGRGMGSAMRALSPEAIAEAAAQIEKLGLNISEIDAAKIEAAGDAVDTAMRVFDGMIQQFTAELAPIITAVSNQFFDAATGVEGFGTAGKTAADGLVNAIAFVPDVVEGVRRTFEVLGKSVAIVMLELDESCYSFAQGVVENVGGALNKVIDAVNSISGLSIDRIDTTGLMDEIEITQLALVEAYDDMSATLAEPMPSDQFKEFVAQARIAAQEAAAADVALKNALRGEGSGEDSGSAKSNDKTEKDQQKKTDANADLMERVNAVRESNATELEIVAQKEATELATLQAAREQKLMSEQEYQTALAETKNRFAQDRLAGIRAANMSELDIMRTKQAEEMAALQTARDQGLVSEADYQALKAETEARFKDERLAGILEANASELEIATEKHALELEQLQTALADKLLTEQEYEAARLDTIKRHADEAAAIKKKEEDEKTRLQKEAEANRKAAMGDALSNLTTLMNTNSRKMFEIGKAAAIAQTVVSTYEGAQKAFTALAATPPLAYAAAGAAIAAGVARVQSIRSQTFGGGASTPTGSNTGQINAGSQPTNGGGGGGGGGGGSSPGTNMYIQGLNKNDLYSGSQLIEVINAAQKDGAKLVIL